MEENSKASDQNQFQANFQIPFDYFVSKKHQAIESGCVLGFTDSFGNFVYGVQHLSHKSKDRPHCIKLFLDASGDTLFSIHRVNVSYLSLINFGFHECQGNVIARIK